jgi:hypothetical protein
MSDANKIPSKRPLPFYPVLCLSWSTIQGQAALVVPLIFVQEHPSLRRWGLGRSSPSSSPSRRSPTSGRIKFSLGQARLQHSAERSRAQGPLYDKPFGWAKKLGSSPSGTRPVHGWPPPRPLTATSYACQPSSTSGVAPAKHAYPCNSCSVEALNCYL